MSSLPVHGPSGAKVDSVEVGGVFSSPVNVPLVHKAVVMQRASERQGTASTKGRGEVRGSGKKPWKQKHTGRARAGSVRSPIWRHGGTVFGPRPRSYGSSLPKKMYRAALRSALSSKVEASDLVVVDLSLSEMKTRELVKLLSQLGVNGKSILVVDDGLADVVRIGKNVRDLRVLFPKDLNVYDVLWCEKLVVVRGALSAMQELWA